MKFRYQTRSLWLATALVAATISPAHAVLAIPITDVSSTFDANDEDWQFVDVQGNAPYTNVLLTYPKAVTYTSSGGNPGGFISATDPSDNTFFFEAPSKFLNDKSAYYGGKLTYDTMVTAGPAWTGDPDVVLVSGSTVIVYDFANNPGSSFVARTVPWTEAGWRMNNLSGGAVSQAQFLQVISNLSAVRILGEFVASPPFETASLDNVVLTPVPEPSEAVLMSLGIVGLLAALRRKKNSATR